MRFERLHWSMATVGITLLFLGTAEAAPQTTEGCRVRYNACSSRCFKKYDTGGQAGFDKAMSCVNRTCARQHDNCLAGLPKPGDTKVETPTGPIRPKGGDVRTPPTGGTKGSPESPHRVNTPRAPMGGGVFHADKSGGGSGGPILKSSGGNGGTFRSNRR